MRGGSYDDRELGWALTVTGIALLMDILLLTPIVAVVNLVLRWISGA